MTKYSLYIVHSCPVYTLYRCELRNQQSACCYPISLSLPELKLYMLNIYTCMCCDTIVHLSFQCLNSSALVVN